MDIAIIPNSKRVFKDTVCFLREHGMTHREIGHFVHRSNSTIALWTKHIYLSADTSAFIQNRIRSAQISPEFRERLRNYARIRLAPYRTKYTDEQLLERIKSFYKQFGRIPMKREFNSYRGFRLRFGSWNNAIIRAGFIPNPSSAKQYISRDGHKCDSLAERMIDDFLFENDVRHERSTPYAGYPKFKTDFVINDVYIEYFGRVGLRDYDDIIIRKRDLCRQKNIRLIELYPNDILEKKKLPVLLAEFIQ